MRVDHGVFMLLLVSGKVEERRAGGAKPRRSDAIAFVPRHGYTKSDLCKNAYNALPITHLPNGHRCELQPALLALHVYKQTLLIAHMHDLGTLEVLQVAHVAQHERRQLLAIHARRVEALGERLDVESAAGCNRGVRRALETSILVSDVRPHPPACP